MSRRLKNIRFLRYLWVLPLVFSCKQFPRKYTFHITSQGDPVDKAGVVLEGDFHCTTTQSGTCTILLSPKQWKTLPELLRVRVSPSRTSPNLSDKVVSASTRSYQVAKNLDSFFFELGFLNEEAGVENVTGQGVVANSLEDVQEPESKEKTEPTHEWVSVYFHSSEGPLQDVILKGLKKNSVVDLCKSNHRGRCTFSLPVLEQLVSDRVMARKVGFQSRILDTLSLQDRGMPQMMRKGSSLDAVILPDFFKHVDDIWEGIWFGDVAVKPIAEYWISLDTALYPGMFRDRSDEDTYFRGNLKPIWFCEGFLGAQLCPNASSAVDELNIIAPQRSVRTGEVLSMDDFLEDTMAL
jgi:hypothetical protein